MTYRDVVLATPGLVGYWRLNEASGASAADSFGSNTATITNVTAYAQTGLLTGDADTSMAFSGSTMNVRDLDVSGLSTTIYSMECWWKNTRALASAGSHGTPFSRGAAAATSDSIIIRGTGGTTQGILSFYNGVHNELPGVITAVNTTYYIVLTRNGSTVKIYLDGALVYTGTHASTFSTSTRFTMGAAGDGTANFQGPIDEVAVYNAELPQATITQHYQAGALGIFPSTLGLSTIPLLIP